MKVREATAGDGTAVREVIKAVYDEYRFSWDPDTYHADLYDLQAHYFDLGDRFYVAEVDGQVLGTGALELFTPIPGEGVVTYGGKRRLGGSDCSLERLYVHPEARRQGLGLALTQKAITEARDRGRRRMEIWSDKRFVEAHRLYERLGAVLVGDRICDDPDESPEWGLVLDL